MLAALSISVAALSPVWPSHPHLQACGWVLFDVAYMAALLIKLGSSDRQ